MADRLADVTDKEKEALRLLLAGHDAKSSARELDVSVHTLNDRLRSVRRKLGVTTSKEAARILGAAEREDDTGREQDDGGGDEGESLVTTPKPLVHKGLGVQENERNQDNGVAADQEEEGFSFLRSRRKGLLIMSLALAASLAALTVVSIDQPQWVEAAFGEEAQNASELQARSWLNLIDNGKFDESYNEAGETLRGQYPQGMWKFGLTLRMTKGKLESRELLQVSRTQEYAGLPIGEYQIVEFNSLFQYNNRQLERVVLQRTPSGWEIADYDMIPRKETPQ